MTTTHPFDSRPLTDPIDPAELRAFGRQLRAGGLAANLVPIAMAVLGVLVFAVVFIGFVGGIIASFADGSGSGIPFLFVSVVLLAVIVTLGVLTVRRWFRPTRLFRLVKFAQANGMEFQTIARDPDLPGMIFRQGRSRVATDIVRGDQPRFVEFGNFRYETGSDKQKQTHRWGYIAIRLDVPLPNIVLDAASNNSFFGSNLPEQFGRHQRLALEGDFDRFFTLYAPEGYEQDALYLFTPDIMARFIDHAAALDVEIVDDWLFLYAQRDMTTLDPAQWAWEFSVVGALTDKLAQWGRWRDERLRAAPDRDAVSPAGAGAPGLPFAAPASAPLPPASPIGVAAGGRRLRQGVPVLALVAMGVVVVGWFAIQLAGAFHP
ncbi:hypothetical protein LK09_19825 [Microbacterium mangrovi]|uniref:DUF3137 domain-containing protein n=1 Tax=Microbacterium mangrovi TaxID=1348253 RepID=A0A0B2A0P1_9MICO|nr:phage holin family protein [Microbacterium mangrovi]KHK95160.1 hypothetical protein LK09_19825 [Microbacterium mangrovi]